MARARNIKPGFFKNEDLAECSPWARLCFIGLWTLADREGRLEDRPKRIKGELFPYDSFEVEPLLHELVRYGFIERYEVDGVRVLSIPKFLEHQAPHIKEKASELPGKNGANTGLRHDAGSKNDAVSPSCACETPDQPEARTVQAQGLPTIECHATPVQAREIPVQAREIPVQAREIPVQAQERQVPAPPDSLIPSSLIPLSCLKGGVGENGQAANTVSNPEPIPSASPPDAAPLRGSLPINQNFQHASTSKPMSAQTVHAQGAVPMTACDGLGRQGENPQDEENFCQEPTLDFVKASGAHLGASTSGEHVAGGYPVPPKTKIAPVSLTGGICDSLPSAPDTTKKQQRQAGDEGVSVCAGDHTHDTPTSPADDVQAPSLPDVGTLIWQRTPHAPTPPVETHPSTENDVGILHVAARHEFTLHSDTNHPEGSLHAAPTSTNRKRGTRLPEDWQPDDALVQWARKTRPDILLDDEIENFKDYWIAKTGSGATKLDWNRTFKGWIRKVWARPTGIGARGSFQQNDAFSNVLPDTCLTPPEHTPKKDDLFSPENRNPDTNWFSNNNDDNNDSGFKFEYTSASSIPDNAEPDEEREDCSSVAGKTIPPPRTQPEPVYDWIS